MQTRTGTSCRFLFDEFSIFVKLPIDKIIIVLYYMSIGQDKHTHGDEIMNNCASDTVEIYDYSGRRVVGVGDEVVISDGHGRLSIDKITAITKATIKTTQKTFTRKSQKEYGSGESWRCARLGSMHPDEARERIKQQQAKDALRRAYIDARKRVHDESDNLTIEDVAAIVAILDNAKQRVDAGLQA